MPEKIFVVIATHNRNELLERTLASLEQCDLPDCYEGTVVVENGGKFGAEPIVATGSERLRAKYLFLEEGNKSAALNFALETIPNEPGVLVYFTDDDIRFEQRLLQRYVDAAKSVQSGEFYIGPAEVDYEEQPPLWLKSYLPASAKGWTPKLDPEPPVDKTRITVYSDGLGCNWSAFVTDLYRVGLFNVNFGPGSKSGATGQESNMMMRLMEAGVDSIYVPGSTVWHYVPGNRCDVPWTIKRGFRRATQIGRTCEAPLRTSMLDLLRILFWGISSPVFYLVGDRYRFRMMYGISTASGRLKGIWTR